MKTRRKKSNEIMPIVFSKEYGFLGHLLYSERLYQHISLEKVAEELKLSTFIVKNLESGQLDSNPGFSYMIGFLRTYANYLGLNEKEIIKIVRPPINAVFEDEVVLKVPFQKQQLPSKKIIFTSVIALCVLFVVYFKLATPTDLSLYSLVHFSEDEAISSLPAYTKQEKIQQSIQYFLDVYYYPFNSSSNTSH